MVTPASCTPSASLPNTPDLAHRDLGSFLETQLKTFGQQSEWSRAEMSAKLDRLESELRQSIEQCQNSLAASMAELDDRLEHGAGESRPRKLT